MSRHLVAWTVLAATLAAAPSLADAAPLRSGEPLSRLCPPAEAEVAAAATLSHQLAALRGRLASLDEVIAELEDNRREALDRAKQQILDAVRRPGLSPEELQAIVDRTVQQATTETTGRALAAEAARRNLEVVRARLEAVEEQMRALEARAGRPPRRG